MEQRFVHRLGPSDKLRGSIRKPHERLEQRHHVCGSKHAEYLVELVSVPLSLPTGSHERHLAPFPEHWLVPWLGHGGEAPVTCTVRLPCLMRTRCDAQTVLELRDRQGSGRRGQRLPVQSRQCATSSVSEAFVNDSSFTSSLYPSATLAPTSDATWAQASLSVRAWAAPPTVPATNAAATCRGFAPEAEAPMAAVNPSDSPSLTMSVAHCPISARLGPALSSPLSSDELKSLLYSLSSSCAPVSSHEQEQLQLQLQPQPQPHPHPQPQPWISRSRSSASASSIHGTAMIEFCEEKSRICIFLSSVCWFP